MPNVPCSVVAKIKTAVKMHEMIMHEFNFTLISLSCVCVAANEQNLEWTRRAELVLKESAIAKSKRGIRIVSS